MPFPKAERVLYNKNPLERVICQLRFPPILRIDSEVPSDFQELIRDCFPFYRENIEILQELPIVGVSNFPSQVNQELKKPISSKNHNFYTSDGTCQLNLTRTFLSLTTTKYSRWEEFRKNLEVPINALVKVYRPPFFTRIGLRYIDIFDRSKLNLEKTPWNELLTPYFLGLLSSPMEEDLISCESKYEINLEDKESLLRVITTFVNKIPTNERCYLVDGDFYFAKKSEVNKYLTKLEFLHEQAIRLIRLIITDKLHQAMEPINL